MLSRGVPACVREVTASSANVTGTISQIAANVSSNGSLKLQWQINNGQVRTAGRWEVGVTLMLRMRGAWASGWQAGSSLLVLGKHKHMKVEGRCRSAPLEPPNSAESAASLAETVVGSGC